MRITVLAGGIGAARFLRGLLAAAPNATITVIGNTADDITLFGLRVCPDLDSVMYTLGGGSDEEQGWGRAGETHRIGDELAAYGAGPSWFTLGDLDFATHILRTQLLAEGKPLSEVTRVLCERWRPGVRLLPMSDDRVETRVKIKHTPDPLPGVVGAAARGRPRGGDHPRRRRGRRARARRARGDRGRGLRAVPPSNPVVSIGPILAVPGIRAAVSAKTVVAVSGIIGGAPVRGMADACLTAIGVETSAVAVAAHYGPELINGWLVDEQDKAAVDDPALAGIAVRALPLYMRDVPSSAAIAQAAVDLAKELSS